MDYSSPQYQLWQHLVTLFRQDKLPHALLFTGTVGIGKLAFMQQLANLCLCNEKQTNAPCQHCRACTLLASHNHPDYLFLDGNENALKIDQIRTISDWLGLTAYHQNRVIILHEVAKMHIAAQNALLKTLEEPPFHSFFFLSTAYPTVILPTIRSRCRIITFPSPLTNQQNPLYSAQNSSQHVDCSSLQIKNYFECHQTLLSPLLEQLSKFILVPSSWEPLQQLTKQWSLRALNDLFYYLLHALLYKQVFQQWPVDSAILRNFNFTLNPKEAWDYATFLNEVKNQLDHQVNLNAQLTEKNLILRFCALCQ